VDAIVKLKIPQSGCGAVQEIKKIENCEDCWSVFLISVKNAIEEDGG
jgi:hypothetical protein